MIVIIIYKIDTKNQEQNNNKKHIVMFYTIFLLIIAIDKNKFSGSLKEKNPPKGGEQIKGTQTT